jgi:hypothetical protein
MKKYCDENGEIDRRIFTDSFYFADDGRSAIPFTYPYETTSLIALQTQTMIRTIHLLHNQNQAITDIGELQDGVNDIFSDAYYQGKLLPLARLIEKTYGPGSFAELGKITEDGGEAMLDRVEKFIYDHPSDGRNKKVGDGKIDEDHERCRSH